MDRRISILVLAAAVLRMPPAVPPGDDNDQPDYQAPDLIDAAVASLKKRKTCSQLKATK